MSGNKKSPSNTQEMEAFRREEKRAFGGNEARGLAAYDKGKKSPSESASRGGGPDIDQELRRARMDSRDDFDDDGMVPTSSSFWPDNEEPSATPSTARDDEDEGGGGRRGGAWKWIVGGLVVIGGGVGAAVAFMGGDAKVEEPAPAVAAKVKAPAEEEEPEEEEPVAAAVDAQAEDAAPEVVAKDAGDGFRVHPATSEAAAWAAGVAASNAWVALGAAPSGRLIGLSDREVNDALASQRTGFVPGAKVAAPDAAFQIQAHEVTWGELVQATTVAEVGALVRPKWLPKDAKRQAELPVTGVPYAVALAFCNGLGGDLPSEAEWEWAARGEEGRYFPWGRDAFDVRNVHIVAGRPIPVVPVTTSKRDVTPGDAGIYDMLGNAREWTRDPFRAADGTKSDKQANHKAIRGWPLAKEGAESPAEGATYRAAGCSDAACAEDTATGTEALAHVGFRCVRRP